MVWLGFDAGLPDSQRQKVKKKKKCVACVSYGCTAISTLQTLFSIFTTTLKLSNYLPHFINEEKGNKLT